MAVREMKVGRTRSDALAAISAALLASSLSACASAQTEVPMPARSSVAAVAGSDVSLLGQGDIVQISVFREPDLGGVYRVGSSGAIDFPLIGTVKLLGKDVDAVARDIRDRLGDGYLKEPTVSVYIREHNSSDKVHVLGQVQHPGSFAYTPAMTVIEAITAAGGFTRLASTNGVSVSRDSGSSEEKFVLPVGDIQAGNAPNFDLLPGDIVFVPETIF